MILSHSMMIIILFNHFCDPRCFETVILVNFECVYTQSPVTSILSDNRFGARKRYPPSQDKIEYDPSTGPDLSHYLQCFSQ